MLITTVIMWVSGIAWASDVAALEAKHDADMKQMKIFSYQKDIDELQLKPNKTQYDQDRLKLWQNKINGMQ